MKLKKEFNNVLFLVATLAFTVISLLLSYETFVAVINLVVVLGAFGLFLTYRYFAKLSALELVMHAVFGFSALFNLVISFIVMTYGGAYATFMGIFYLFFVAGLSLVYLFYYLLDEKAEGEKPAEKKVEEKKEDKPVEAVKAEKAPAEEVKAEEKEEDAVNSEIKELNAAYAQGNLTAEEYDEKMKNLQNKDI